MRTRFRSFSAARIAPTTAWRGSSGQRKSPLLLIGAVLGVAALSLLAGFLSVIVGDFANERPVFFAALPLLILIGFTLLISPKALLLAIILLRGGANSFFDGAKLGSLGGLGGVINLAVIVLAIVLLLREPGRVPRAAWWAWLPFLAMQFVGLPYSPDPFAQLRLALGQVSTFAMFLIAFHLVDDLRSLRKAFGLIVASSVPVVLLTLLSIATGDVASSLEGAEAVYGRYSGPFSHPNILAFYLVVVIAVLFYLWKRPDSATGPGYRSAAVLYLVVLLGLLFATKTRSAWLATALLFFLYGVFVERRYLLYLVAVPMLGMLIPEFRDRVADLTQGNEVIQYARLNSFAWRQLIWTEGLAWMEPSRYLAGYGAGGFFHHSTSFFSLAGGRPWGAHSVIVQLMFDLGVLGVASYLWLFWSCFKMMRPAFRLDLLLAILFVAALSGYLLISLSDNLLAYLVYNWYFWLAIGAVCAVAGGREMRSRDSAGVEPARSG